MDKSLPTPFPAEANVSEDSNPAIRLFGKRFIVDQPIPELLVEFLLVAFSEKNIGSLHQGIKSPLPSLEQIRTWPNGALLGYRPTIKLNLKLFSFLSSSRIDTRHEVHRQQFKRLWQELQSRTHSSSEEPEEVVAWLEDLLKGFRGAGFNRTWCAQSFFPVAKSLLTPETIWNETVVKTRPVATWDGSLQKFSDYYSISRRNFLARGGEVLYLQLCNVFAQDPAEVRAFASSFTNDEKEKNLENLYDDLHRGLQSLYGRLNNPLDNLVNYIESLDERTRETTMEVDRTFTCEWCPEESWKEGYLFALELKRLLLTSLDPVEKLELMMTGCALQILRSLCAQSVRYVQSEGKEKGTVFELGGGLHYACVFTPIVNPAPHLLLTSQRNLQVVQTLIQKAVRVDALIENVRIIEGRKSKKRQVSKVLQEADDKYGYKLFRAMGKKLGIIVPYKGPGARFVMTDGLLRYFILTLLKPGCNCSYEGFLERLYANHGIAVEGEHLDLAMRWSQLPPNLSTEYEDSSWLRDMLRAGGFLTELSDGYPIVTNTFGEL